MAITNLLGYFRIVACVLALGLRRCFVVRFPISLLWFGVLINCVVIGRVLTARLRCFVFFSIVRSSSWLRGYSLFGRFFANCGLAPRWLRI